ncbi:MAG: glycosyltransferase family 1 protein [Alteromonas macleodii]|nr:MULTISPECIES: glycosyltransferase family 1 protein [Alteromonas]MDM8172553.1 glycosyltransferase family 1 protein [Alteromonas macleodii]NOH57228.1 glycosyltransferase family 4 protein [Alteromonas sp. 07-89-2]CAI3963999.1 glycosyltransferase involved in cell wall biosynthesis [Alteromonas macleodii]VTP56745.1 glycosyltransferase involved in cell wall biosynthesis [Alteromonas macleodii]
MKKKKVAIDARFVLRKQRGMPLYTFMLCKLIPKILYQHQFVLFINKGFEHNDSAEKYQVRLDEICKLDNVEIVNADAEDEISWEQLILPKLLKTHKVDLLHMPGNRVCLFTRVKQITTTHDLMEWHSLKIFRYYKNRSLKENFYFFRQKAYLWAVYRLGLSFSDHVLTISQYSKRDITQSFPKLKNKSSYVYHGIPRGFKPPLNNTSKQGVLMLGGDSHQKNPENMLKAWAQLPEELQKAHPLTILGFVGGEDSIISKTIRALGIENDIVIKGWVTEDELIQAMQTSKVFIFASREEGFGFPLVQSMASGTPVVTSEADVLIEIGQDAICSAKAEDFLALSSAVGSLLTDEQLYNEKVKKGLTISSKFTWEHTAEHIASTYLTLLK